MPDPESLDRDEGLRRGRSFEPADDRMWELPVDASDQPAPRKAHRVSRMMTGGLVALVIIIVLLVLWLI